MLRVKMGNKLFKLLSNRKNPYRIFVPLASWAEATVGTKKCFGCDRVGKGCPQIS